MTLALSLGACGGATDDSDALDQELTPDEAALLPAPEQEADEAELSAAENPPLEDDAALFDTDQADETLDVPVDDDPELTKVVATPVEPTLEAAHLPLLHWGLHPRASDALRSVGIASWRIMQTIGNAPASAGTHLQDGSVNGHPYCAATDISVSGLSNAQVANLLERLAKVGFAAFYRWPGHDHWPSSGARHIHAVYANAKMKSMLRSQVRSWLVGRNGLISNAVYTFHRWSAAARTVVRNKFRQSAYGTTNGGSSCFVGGYYCGGDKISGDRSTLYRCTGSGAPALVRHCSRGCSVNPGSDDSCR